MAHLFLCEEAQAPTQPEKKTTGSKSRDEDNDDVEIIFVGVQHVNEGAETFFVRVILSSKPVISNILNSDQGRIFKKKEGPRESRSLLHVVTCKSQDPSMRASSCITSFSVWMGRKRQSYYFRAFV